MTGPSSSPAAIGKIAGVALWVVAAAALVLGIVSLTIPGGTQHAASGGPRGAGGGSGAGGHAVGPGSSGAAGAPHRAGGPGSGAAAPERTTVAPPPTRAPGTGPARANAGNAGGREGAPARGSAGSPRAGARESGHGRESDGQAGTGHAVNGQIAPVKLRAVPVRVYNNGTVRGMAHRVAGQMRHAGWHVTTAGNYPESHGIIPASTVYYRSGTREHAVAEKIGKHWDMRVKPRFPGIRSALPGVIVILTSNWHAAGAEP